MATHQLHLGLRTYPSVEELLARVSPPLPEKFAAHVRKAYEIAEKAHAGQERRSGEPYFSHCVAVAMSLAEYVGDWASLAAALLHDSIEDCGITKEQIRAALPDPVADLVDGVTKISSINLVSDREHQANNLRKMILAMARDIRVILIKLCDRLHNMRTLQYLSPEKQKAIATSTLELYAPLATRLGMEQIGDELEDLSMSYLQPVIYRRLIEHMERNGPRYQQIIHKTQTILENSLSRALIPAKVSGRLKHTYSLYQKMLKGGLGITEIHDLVAMRIITETIPQTYEALGIVHSRWKPVEGRFKDYIASPKPNGYRSLHTTVLGVEGELIEIQIRTREMHTSATEGLASHWKYKEDGSASPPEAVEAEKLAWLRQLVDFLADIRDPQEWLATVKQDVFDASVFCYTPQGDVIELPKGSSALDFAYRIHTEVGTHCSAAKVNQKLVPLRTKLKTGDIVEIITSKSAHPSRDWVQFAHTNRARNKIRHWLKINDRPVYLERGRRSFFLALEEKMPHANEAEALRQLEKLAPVFSFPSGEELLIEIGAGTLKAGQVVAKMTPPPGQVVVTRQPPPRQGKRPAKRIEAGIVLVEGMPGALVRMAKCCAPTPGDAIVGFVTQGRGISVHREDCKSIRRTQELHDRTPNRFISVQWSDGVLRQFRATVRITCQDRQGLLKDLSQSVTQLGISITDVHSHSNLKTNRATIRITVLLADENELNTLLKRLESIPSVRSVSRVIHSR